MSISVAFQMNHVSTIDKNTDTTFVLALEAQKRGYKVFHYQPENLSFYNGILSTKAEEIKLYESDKNFFSLYPTTRLILSELDIIFMRQDPPFNMSYITATHLLEKIKSKVLILNNPSSVRNSPEKIFVTEFEKLMPPTLISSDKEDISNFRRLHKDIVIKPLFANGGLGVVRLNEKDENFSSILETYSKIFFEPLVVQKFLPEVRSGDKRIILLDGEPIGAINRVPAKGEMRANLHVGAIAQKSVLTNEEIDICSAIGPKLKQMGLMLVGIDVIGNKYLTEINVTSPTGIQEINAFDQTNLQKKIWDKIEQKLKEKL
tara:strand:- start:221 stop:1174 length:954 start_codon:yes stop_codon:yes gene_type:complete